MVAFLSQLKVYRHTSKGEHLLTSCFFSECGAGGGGGDS